MTAMAATTSFLVNHNSSQNANRGFKAYNGNRHTGRGQFIQGSRHFHSRPVFSSMTHEQSASNPGVLGPSPHQSFHGHPASIMSICQLCNSEGHNAPSCDASSYKRPKFLKQSLLLLENPTLKGCADLWRTITVAGLRRTLDNQLRLRFLLEAQGGSTEKRSHGSDGEVHGGVEECTVGAA
ncbi:hypothetical protein POTOM_045319 [Populus tomentosa]|uniref:Uncharacterized protein n=1 Tax=Populus tomentosa TaxID=118781 RepID=A0A8X8CF62_POPTO|nr:hypothetical protein POTOM_045319 [Populus tomentosa]